MRDAHSTPTHDHTIASILEAIRQLMTPPAPKQRPVGFVIPKGKYRLKTTNARAKRALATVDQLLLKGPMALPFVRCENVGLFPISIEFGLVQAVSDQSASRMSVVFLGGEAPEAVSRRKDGDALIVAERVQIVIA